jgi:hypothetical protein
MSRTTDEEGIQVVFLDESVHMDVREALSSIGAPMSQESGLDVVFLEWFFEERVVLEVDHA